MELLLRDPAYADRLVAFLASLGQRAVVAAPDRLELPGNGDETSRLEVEIYLRIWGVLHPEAEAELAA